MAYTLNVRLDDEEKAKLEVLAKERKLTISAFIRMEIIRMARKRRNGGRLVVEGEEEKNA